MPTQLPPRRKPPKSLWPIFWDATTAIAAAVMITEIIAQGVWKGLRIREIPIATRYFDEASQIGFRRSVRYGFAVLGVLLRYKLHKKGIRHSHIFR